MHFAWTVGWESTFFAVNWISQYFVLKPVFFWVLQKFSHFLFKNAFRINCRLRNILFVVSWIFQYFVLKPVFYWVLHHFLFKTAFCINCRLTKTCSVLNWIFKYFLFKPLFYWVFTPFIVKSCVLLKFNHFLFKNAFRINCRLRKTVFLLTWIFQYFVLKAEFPGFYTISCLKLCFASTVGCERPVLF